MTRNYIIIKRNSHNECCYRQCINDYVLLCLIKILLANVDNETNTTHT